MEGFESFVGIDFWTALFTLCNMIITFLLLKKFLFKPIRNIIDGRQQEVDNMFAKAEEAQKEAQQLKDDYAEKFSGMMAERDRIINEATARGRQKEEEIVSEAQAEAEKMIEKAQADIALEKRKALEEVRDDISDLAISIAEKVTDKEINADDQKNLVASFIDALGN